MARYNNHGNQIMSDLFPPISESARINTRYQPVEQVPQVVQQSHEVRRVFSDKEIVDTIEVTTYDRGGSVKTSIMTSQSIIDFIV